MGEIYAAKTNHITNPVGYALKPLVFSWKVKGCKGQEQRHAVNIVHPTGLFVDQYSQ
jgi:alpha-L-rhamnosidase